MTVEEAKYLISLGETTAVEFKRAGNGLHDDTYQTVCSFSNRFGGDIFLGVLDNGDIEGVPEKAARDLIKNFISVLANPKMFSPTLYLEPKMLSIDGKTVLQLHIPNGSDVVSYKGVVYDRMDDADVPVNATSQKALLYIRKQNIYTEKKIYPYVTMQDLRTDLFPEIRLRAKNHAGGIHPWEKMTDEQMLKSAGLYTVDRVSGERGFNLAGILLLGQDEVITDVLPAYMTDALLRKVQTERYDDREIVKTNLVDSFGVLMEFAKKHLPDKFYLEDTVNISLRNIILREMIANLLIHREYSSSYVAKFIVENDKFYTENASRATKNGMLTPENIEPIAKNPIMASFFRVIGFADQLGSGVRNLYKYAKLYSGNAPGISEGDIFRIEIHFDEENMPAIQSDENSIQSEENPIQSEENPVQSEENPVQSEENPIQSNENPVQSNENPIQSNEKPVQSEEKPVQSEENPIQSEENPVQSEENPVQSEENPIQSEENPIQSNEKPVQSNENPIQSDSQKNSVIQKKMLSLLKENPTLTSEQIAQILSISKFSAKYYLTIMKERGQIVREGNNRKGKWIVKQ